MPVFSARTTAWKRRSPISRAAAARCSSSTEPMPRPWWASATTNATSASSVPGCALVAADGDDLAGQLGDERDPVVVVDVGEPVQVALGDARVGREVAQVAGALRQPGVERDERVGVARAGSGAGAPCRRRRRRRRPPSAAGGSGVRDRVGRRLGVAQSRGSSGSRPSSGNDRPAGGADRAVEPALAARLPGTTSGSGRSPIIAGSSPRTPRLRRCSIQPAGHRGVGRRRGGRWPRPAGASRCAGRSGPAPYPPPPKASHLPPVDLVGQPVQLGDRGALPVDGELEVGERVLVVGVAAALRDQHVRRERAHRARAPPRRNARSQPASSVPGGSATLTAVPSAAPAPISVGRPVPGNSVRGSWCRLIVSTRGSS